MLMHPCDYVSIDAHVSPNVCASMCVQTDMDICMHTCLYVVNINHLDLTLYIENFK